MTGQQTTASCQHRLPTSSSSIFSAGLPLKATGKRRQLYNRTYALMRDVAQTDLGGYRLMSDV